MLKTQTIIKRMIKLSDMITDVTTTKKRKINAINRYSDFSIILIHRGEWSNYCNMRFLNISHSAIDFDYLKG